MALSQNAAEIELLEETIAWRLRLLDADPADQNSIAVRQLEGLLVDLQGRDHEAARLELTALLNWLSESEAIADYSELSHQYRSRIGVTDYPADGAAYLRALVQIAQSLT